MPCVHETGQVALVTLVALDMHFHNYFGKGRIWLGSGAVRELGLRELCKWETMKFEQGLGVAAVVVPLLEV